MSHHYLWFDDVHYRYPNGYEALCGVSFRITHGEKVALVGANGAGKSTLLLHTNGLLMPSQGEVVMGGITLTRRTLPLVRQSVGLVFQDSDNQLFMPTVEEDVAFGPANMRLEPEEIRRRVTEALNAVGALDLREASPFRLSGGQKKRVAIATVLAMEPSVLVMDEPTSSLTDRETEILMNVIRNLRDQGVTVVFISHRLSELFEISDRITVLRDGRLVGEYKIAELPRVQLVSKMLGKELDDLSEIKTEGAEDALENAEVVYEASGLSSAAGVRPFDFSIRKGEVNGFTGLLGHNFLCTLAGSFAGSFFDERHHIFRDSHFAHPPVLRCQNQSI